MASSRGLDAQSRLAAAHAVALTIWRRPLLPFPAEGDARHHSMKRCCIVALGTMYRVVTDSMSLLLYSAEGRLEGSRHVWASSIDFGR
jgi:hypothetical protein